MCTAAMAALAAIRAPAARMVPRRRAGRESTGGLTRNIATGFHALHTLHALATKRLPALLEEVSCVASLSSPLCSMHSRG